MSQGSTVLATAGVFSGAVEQAAINSALAALLSNNSGASAPSSPTQYQFWVDTSGGATNGLLKMYDGASWLALAKIDTTNHIITPIANGLALFAATFGINQAATTDLSTATSNIVDLLSTSATITGFGTVAADRIFFVRVNTATPGSITNSGALICVGGANIPMAQNDLFILKSLGSGNWIMLDYVRASGVPLKGLKQGKTTIAWDAAGMVARTTAGATPNAYESATNKINVKTMDFPKAASPVTTFAQFKVPMPKSWDGGTVTARIFCRVKTTSAANAFFGIGARAYGQGDALDAAIGTAQNITITGTGTADQMIVSSESSAITVAGTPAGNKEVIFELSRLAGNGSDTMATGATVSVEAIHIYYTTNAADDS